MHLQSDNVKVFVTITLGKKHIDDLKKATLHLLKMIGSSKQYPNGDFIVSCQGREQQVLKQHLKQTQIAHQFG